MREVWEWGSRVVWCGVVLRLERLVFRAEGWGGVRLCNRFGVCSAQSVLFSMLLSKWRLSEDV